LTLLFSDVNLSINYFVWALPFLILSGSLLAASLIELLLAWPTTQLWLLSPHPPLSDSYAPLQVTVLLAMAVIIIKSIATDRRVTLTS
jgi:hypothetical protein